SSPEIVEDYSENVVDTLHKKHLLSEDRYLTTLMLKTFPTRRRKKLEHVLPVCTVPDCRPDLFRILLSQRR
ncbi:chitin synthase-domain-containing protein, partial [Mycena vitilis]